MTQEARLPPRVDDGCEFSPTCLDCPLERCKYDITNGKRVQKHAQRNRDIRRLHSQGKSVDYLSRRFGLVRRSIQRILHDDLLQSSH